LALFAPFRGLGNGRVLSRARNWLHLFAGSAMVACFPAQGNFPRLTLVAPFPGLGNGRVLSRAKKLSALGIGRMIWLGVLIGLMCNCFGCNFILKKIVVPGGEAGDIGGSSVSSPSSALALSLHKPCT